MTLAEAFRVQARACADLGSPFMDVLCTLLADHWPAQTEFGRLCASWPGDLGPAGASLPLRIAGGLHALVLRRAAPELAAVYPPAPTDRAALQDAVLAALESHADFLTDWVQSPPQTNEVRRAAALIAGAHWIAARHPLPFNCLELGASAGLNLNWDRFSLRIGSNTFGPAQPLLTLTPEWSGPLPPPRTPVVADRRGVDLNPLNPADVNDALRLRAYLWPDQPNRIRLTDAAMTAPRAQVDRQDAIDWLAQRLSARPSDRLTLIYHTIAWQYFPPDRQAEGTRLIEAAGETATANAPLAWLSMEADGKEAGAALTVRLWPGEEVRDLGRVDFHGRWLRWTAPDPAAT